MNPIIVLGIDLAGSPKRPTGICYLEGLHASTHVALSDEEVLAAAGPNVRLIAIDAPLSLPRGRCCLRSDCQCVGKAHFRKCDLEVRALGIRIFPLTIGPMRMLTERGMRLKTEFEKSGFDVIETFPGGAQDIWGMPRQKDPVGLRRSLRDFGVKGDIGKSSISVHEMDAITCALVARAHIQGKSLSLGDPDEGQMILSKPSKQWVKNRPKRK
jgi:predicted nuclease with RNAse H fold